MNSLMHFRTSSEDMLELLCLQGTVLWQKVGWCHSLRSILSLHTVSISKPRSLGLALPCCHFPLKRCPKFTV